MMALGGVLFLMSEVPLQGAAAASGACFLQIFLRKGVALGYVGRSQTLKDLKGAGARVALFLGSVLLLLSRSFRFERRAALFLEPESALWRRETSPLWWDTARWPHLCAHDALHGQASAS
ncbi:hypothetical protein T484DRAFT_2677209 [Baffinella frigidus]|nr:hypothetical protein T484DRAFT_2677209 [Cryptophyta sp. CCMP2293]